MNMKKIWSMILLSIGVFSLWTFIITFFLLQDDTMSIEQHAYSQRDYIEKQDIQVKQFPKISEQVNKESTEVEIVVNLDHIITKEDSNKVSIDTILAALNNE